jgi:hypothetical protein
MLRDKFLRNDASNFQKQNVFFLIKDDDEMCTATDSYAKIPHHLGPLISDKGQPTVS